MMEEFRLEREKLSQCLDEYGLEFMEHKKEQRHLKNEEEERYIGRPRDNTKSQVGWG